MIYTVFSTSANPRMQWQSELLEYSWGRVEQPGELVRLVAAAPGEALPRHRLARVVETSSWWPHPYTSDPYLPYNKAASLLEWLVGESIEGTVLLLEPDCVFRGAVTTEVEPGRALATAWPELPRETEGPFGLGASYRHLDQFCVLRTLELSAVQLPLLIHSSDLRKLAARWLELTGIIRSEMALVPPGARDDADDVAYVVAAAEAHLPHDVVDLAVEMGVSHSESPILHYRRPIESSTGEVVWDKRAYQAWQPVEPERAANGSGRELLERLAEFVTLQEAGGEIAFLRLHRRKGVREGRVLDQTLLEIPGRSDTLSLNPSAAAIWQLCDGKHSLTELARALEARFEMEPGSLRDETASVIGRLEEVGALELRAL